MDYISDRFVNSLIIQAHAMLESNPLRAYSQADQIIALLDQGALISESPQVIVDKARALRDRAKLAAMYKRTIVKDDALTDLERTWYERR